MRRAVIYARYSSHSQRSESIEIQLERSYEYAEQEGLEVVGTYCDYAQTGRTTDRAEFQRLLKDASTGLFDAVIVYKVTRIMRNRDEMGAARILLRRCGVEILYAGEQVSIGSAGVLQLGMLEVLAEYESALDSERIRDGIAKNAQRCMANGQQLFGWDIGEDGRYVLNAMEHEALVKMRRMVMDGRTLADAARAVAHVRGKRGGALDGRSVRKLLMRVQNAGVYSYAGHEQEGGMPEQWTMAEQEALWEALGSRLRPHKRREGEPDLPAFPLTGKLFCAKCGEPMVGTSGTSHTGARHYYYRCRKCRRSLRQDAVEACVASAVMGALEDERNRETIADLMEQAQGEKMSGPSLSDTIRAQLKEVEAAFGRVWEAIESGFAPPGGKERIERLKQRQAALEGELRAAVAVESARIDRERVLFWLEEMAAEQDAATLLSVFVARVEVDGDVLTVFFTFDGTPPDGGGGGSKVRMDGPQLHHRPVGRTLAFGLFATLRGFALVTEYKKDAR